MVKESTQCKWVKDILFILSYRKSVACPIIDVISDDTFEYITGSDMTWGGFNWKLNFRWYPVPQRELDRRGGDRSQPTRYQYICVAAAESLSLSQIML